MGMPAKVGTSLEQGDALTALLCERQGRAHAGHAGTHHRNSLHATPLDVSPARQEAKGRAGIAFVQVKTLTLDSPLAKT